MNSRGLDRLEYVQHSFSFDPLLLCMQADQGAGPTHAITVESGREGWVLVREGGRGWMLVRMGGRRWGLTCT